MALLTYAPYLFITSLPSGKPFLPLNPLYVKRYNEPAKQLVDSLLRGSSVFQAWVSRAFFLSAA
ncbi:MAG TPA: hypothetical protein VEJ67_15200 [Candidatus Cybelea sp.]|nr:hypothetical protein [Candidatus Cybelea sp.]